VGIAPKLKALVVYSRVGGGHLSAARALAAELEATGRCTARLVDAYLECGRFPVTLFPRAYAHLARNHPRLWSLLYHGSERGLNPSTLVGPFLRSGFKRLLDEARPDVVISVLPVINGPLAEAAKEANPPTEVVLTEVVLTDWHSLHPFWVASGVDHYTAPTESARYDCVRFGAAVDSVDVVGIPVRREFAQLGERADLRAHLLARLGLDPGRFTILAMMGAEGSPRALRNVASLARHDLDAQLVVVCGHSDELRRRVQHVRARIPLRTLGFVEHVADLMRASDLLVTKAGGVTLAEAFCCAIPVVIHDLLPGQESGNLEYVRRHEAVEFARRPSALASVVAALRADPKRLGDLRERGARLARPQAARQIAKNVLTRTG
jgi:UDP-N-acetylglucosamine:LPS N-acetylglucosamine transferase